MVDRQDLSSDEVETLLGDTDGPSNSSTSAPPSSPTAAREVDAIRRRLMALDTPDSDAEPPKSSPSIEPFAEALAREISRCLSESLRTRVAVKLAGVARITFAQFMRGLAVPTCVSVIAVTSSNEKIVVDVSPSILFPMIDRMLGGSGDSGSIERRPLTDIERRLAARIVTWMLGSLTSVSDSNETIATQIECVESDPRRIETLPAAELTALLTFEVSMGAGRGMIDFAISTNLAQQLNRPAGQSDTDSATSELIAYLAETTLPGDQLAELAVGDVIMTDQRVEDPLIVRIEGRTLKARPGSIDGRKAVRIVN
jgi:flagellar motor switch protein FliM